MEGIWSPAEQRAIADRTKYTAVGSAETIRRRVEEVVARTQPDEIIAMAQIYDHAARLRSFEFEPRMSLSNSTSRTSSVMINSAALDRHRCRAFGARPSRTGETMYQMIAELQAGSRLPENHAPQEQIHSRAAAAHYHDR
jgi:hypothetical protein